jgi:S-adenosylmethionine synthetase
MKNITISQLDVRPVAEQNMEYVERKGIGHPDSLIDGICDATSVALCKRYIEETGTIMHHNVDKGLVVGGAVEVGYGKGRITKKIEVIVTGRATALVNGKSLDVNGIAIEVAKDYLRKNTRFLDVDTEVKFGGMIAAGSSDLVGVFERARKEVPLANDTSFGIGFAPFTDVERLVLETEAYLNSKAYKAKEPSAGEDIKVMGMRDKDRITLTVAIAFISKFVDNIDTYVGIKERIAKDVVNNAKKFTKKDVRVEINTGDSIEKEDIYLTKTGLSCESGDDGSVGRGNRVNGLITPFRHMSLEAAAGKNPVNHIGKIYNILATEMAMKITKEYPEIKECDISILSQIGKKISEPHNLNINVITEQKSDFENIRGKVYYIAEGMLDNMSQLTLDISLGKHKTF